MNRSAAPAAICRPDQLDYLFISPSLLEPASKRGGGIEELDFQIAKHFPEGYHTAFLGPFYSIYRKWTPMSPGISIQFVAFPAVREYPFSSRGEVFWTTVIGMPIYCVSLAFSLFSLRRANPVFVVVHNGLPGVVAALFFWSSQAKIVYSEGNTYPWIDPFPSAVYLTVPQRGMRLLKVVAGRLLGKLAWCVRAQSDGIKRGMVSKGLRGSKVTVIPAGVDPLFHSPVNGITTGSASRVGFVGRLDEAKGAPLLLRVVQLAGKVMPKARFVILGDGVFRSQFEEQANVEHVGWVDREQLKLKLSGVSMVLSFQKEFGLGELEAMAAAKAMIASTRGEVSNIIRHLDNGFLCDPTPEAYVSAIVELSNNIDILSRLALRARETAIEAFSWDKIARAWLSMTSEGR